MFLSHILKMIPGMFYNAEIFHTPFYTSFINKKIKPDGDSQMVLEPISSILLYPFKSYIIFS